jgi:hypothetical protein
LIGDKHELEVAVLNIGGLCKVEPDMVVRADATVKAKVYSPGL